MQKRKYVYDYLKIDDHLRRHYAEIENGTMKAAQLATDLGVHISIIYRRSEEIGIAWRHRRRKEKPEDPAVAVNERITGSGILTITSNRMVHRSY